MLHALVSGITIILAINLIIFIHEMGHFLVAKYFRVTVTHMTIGLGTVLYTRVFRGIHWRFALLPLGGYVTLLDTQTNIVPKTQYHKTFNAQKTWKKICIYLAGPLVNLLTAVILYSIVFFVGITEVKPVIQSIIPGSIIDNSNIKPGAEITHINHKPTRTWQAVSLAFISAIGSDDTITVQTHYQEQYQTATLAIQHWHINSLDFNPIESLGIIPYKPHIPIIITKIIPNSPADGVLAVGDQIIAVNAEHTKDFHAFEQLIAPLANTEIELTVQRAGNLQKLHLTTSYRYQNGWRRVGYVGFVPQPAIWDPSMLYHQALPFITAITKAFSATVDMLHYNAILLGKILDRTIPLAILSGPIGFIRLAANALNSGFIRLLQLCAIINILLAFVNLLPVPGLDGGNIMLRLYEHITKKNLNAKLQQLIITLCGIFLIVLTIHATINDITRLVG